MQAQVSIPAREQVTVRGLNTPAMAALGLGVLALLATLAMGFMGSSEWTQGATDEYGELPAWSMAKMGHSLLVGILWAQGICIGGLFFVILHHVTSAGWSVVVRRVAEGVTAGFVPLFFLVLAVCVIPAMMGNDYIYDWANEDWVHAHPLVEHKIAYFNPIFLLVRICFYYAVWIGLSRFFAKHSSAQDEDQDPRRTIKMQRMAGVGMVLFALTSTFAVIDLSMALNAEWFSTMYGVYFFAGSFWSFLALLALLTMWFEKRGQLKDVVTVEHYHDVGKLMFAFTFFWSYVAFSQFMLYWYADMPETTGWFHYRMWGDWTPVSLALVAGHFFIPMLGLMSRHVKRHRFVLGFWAVYVLTFHFVDMYWNVMPELHHGISGEDPAHSGVPWHLMDITALCAVAGIVLFAVLKRFEGKPAVAIGDPRLSESMSFENY